jgi:hypothetical protein
MGFGLVTGFIGHLKHVRTISSTSISHTLQFFSVCCLFTSPLVTASNGERSHSSGFPNCPHASATAIINSQWTELELNSSSHL